MKTYTPEQEERFLEVLRGIQRSIPQSLRDKIVETKPLSPTVKMVMEEAIKTESIPQEKRDQIQRLLNTGRFSKEVLRENEKYVKMVDNYVNREINRAIKEGRLPPKSHVKHLPSIKKINENEKANSSGEDKQ